MKSRNQSATESCISIWLKKEERTRFVKLLVVSLVLSFMASLGVADENQSAESVRATRTSTPAAQQTPAPAQEKDWWDKAQVVSQFFAGVVIGLVGLVITLTIQRTRARASRENVRAQIESAELRAVEERKLQQGILTGQLVEHLTSETESIREIAIVALRKSVAQSTYESIV